MTVEQPITVLGSSGWIGEALVRSLEDRGYAVSGIERSNLGDWLKGTEVQGPVIYTIGLTADFREKPYETVEAHVDIVSKVLRRRGVTSLLYFSSTRVYARGAQSRENSPISCLSSDPSDLYNLSKLLGEALVLQDPRPGMRVVRLSNVVGENQPQETFIGSLLADSFMNGRALIRQPPETTKDYVRLNDIVRLVPEIAIRGKHRIYNLGSGINKTHADVVAWLNEQGVTVEFSRDREQPLKFSPLCIDRLKAEFDGPGDPFKEGITLCPLATAKLRMLSDKSE